MEDPFDVVGKSPQLQSQPAPERQPPQKRTIKNFLLRAVAWPTNDESGWINLHWHLPGARFHGRGFRNVDEFCKSANALAQSKQSNLYFCLSRQAIAAERDTKDALAFKAIWLDLDVKKKGYATIEEAIDALFDFIKHYKLPYPSAIISSGNGLHVYWFSDRTLPYAEWRPYAEGLKAAALQWELKCDVGVIADAARVLRVPGTRNFKTDPPKPVLLEHLQANDIDFAADLKVLLDLSPRTGGAGATALNGIKTSKLFEGRPLRQLGKGIVLPEIPPLPFPPIKEGCAWLREAHDTGGKDHDQPQWHLAVLAATFIENGHELAHQLSNQHPDYKLNPEKTEEMWARKIRERKERGIGWPHCEKIQDAGSKHCRSCPHIDAGETPLHLALRQEGPRKPAGTNYDAEDPWDIPPTSITWDPTELNVSFANIPHRRWVYGTYLVRGEITIVGAPGGVGKTALITGMAIEIAAGTELLEEKIWGTNLKVLSINGEDGTVEINRRMWAFARAYTHLLGEQTPDRLYVVGADDARIQRMSFLRTVKNVSRVDDSGFAALESALEAIRPDVLMLDSLVAFCGGGNMNDNAVMALVMRGLKRLAVKYDCAVLVVHHTAKGGERGDAEAVSGAAAIVNLARRTLMPVPMTTDDAKNLEVLPSERFRYFKLVDAKANFAPRSEDSPWYRLHSVELPNAEPPIYPYGDNVQAVVRETLPLKKTADEAANDQKIQRAILDLVDRGKLIEGEWYPYSPHVSGAKNMRALLDDAITAVHHATAPRQWLPGDLQAVVHRAIDKMKVEGWLYVEEITKGRFRGRTALCVEWRDTPWSKTSPAGDGTGGADEEKPAGGNDIFNELDPEADATTGGDEE